MKKITIKDIANEANVSIGTVSNVINGTGRVSEATKEKIRGIISKYNYSPNAAARSLRDKNTQLIALVVPYLTKGQVRENPFYWQLISGVENGARDHKFHVIFTGIKDDPGFSFLSERNIDGLIVVGAREDSLIVDKVSRLKIPAVFIDSYLSNPDLYQIYLNDKMGGYLGTKYLIDLGHRNIILLSGDIEKGNVNYYRYLGYLEALEEAGIEYNEDLIISNPATMVGGYHSAQVVFEKRATAVFTLSDVSAMGLIKGLNELGLSVPNDISVVGFDDFYFSEFLTPSLTTIRQDIFSKGQMAVNMLLDQIENKGNLKEKKVMLPVELKVRQSTTNHNK